MSDNIDQRIVRMQFDNQQFEQGIRQSVQSMENFQKKLNMSKSMGDPIDSIAMNVDKLTDRFSVLGEVIHNRVYRVVDNLVGSVEKMVKSMTVDQIGVGMGKYSKKTTAVATIKSALPDTDLSVIYTQLEKLNKYTDETSYDFTSMVENIGKFTAAGVGLEEAEAAMEGIASATALAGGNVQAANRVMYNFSQAMGAGYVGLMDWMSVENANVATKQFKETIIETAIEMGKLKKVGDKITTSKGTSIDYKNFRSTLNEKWFTKDILTATLAKYADQTTEFGNNAFMAAKQARTFEDAINAVKDAVSTGWMTTFELIFGNVDEATELWTDFCEAIIDALAPFDEFRNSVLGFWKENGGREQTIEGISNAAQGLWGIIEVIGDAFRSMFPEDLSDSEFADFFGQKLLTFSENIQAFGDKVQSVFGFTKEEIVTVPRQYGLAFDAISKFTAIDAEGNAARRLFDIADGLDQFATSTEVLKRGSKGDLVKVLQQQLSNLGYLDDLGEAGIDGIFGPKTEAALKRFQEEFGFKVTGVFSGMDYKKYFEANTVDIEEETKTVYTFGGVLERLRTIFQAAFSLVRLAAPVATRLFDTLMGGVGTFLNSVGTMIESLSWVAEIITRWSNKIHSSDIFGWLYDRFKWLINFMMASKIWSFFSSKVPHLGILSSISLAITGIRWLIANVPKIGTSIQGGVAKAGEKLQNVSEKFGNLKKTLADMGTTAKANIIRGLTPVTEWLGNAAATAADIPGFLMDMHSIGNGGWVDLKEKYGDQLPALIKIYETYYKIRDAISSAYTIAKDKFLTVLNTIGNSKPIAWIKDTFESAKESVMNFLDANGLLQPVVDIFDNISTSVKTAIDWIKKFFGIGMTDEERLALQADAILAESGSSKRGGASGGGAGGGSAGSAMAMTEEEIKAFQKSAQALGLYDGAIDGISGPKTKAAAEAMQELYGDLLGDDTGDGSTEKKKTMWESLSELCESVWTTISTYVSPILDKVSAWFKSAKDWFTNAEGEGVFDKLWNGIKKFLGLDKLKPSEVTIPKVVEAAIEKLVSGITWLFDLIFPAFSSLSWSVTGGVTRILAPILAMTAIFGVLNFAFKIFDDWALIRNRGAERENILESVGDVMLKLAASIGILAIAIKIIAGIPGDDIWKGLGTITALGLLMLGFYALMNVIGKHGQGDLKNQAQMMQSMLTITTAIAILAGLVWALQFIDGGAIAAGIIKMGFLGGFALGLMYLTNVINKTTGGKGTIEAANSLLKVSAAIAILAGIAILLGMTPSGIIWRGIGALTAIAALMVVLMFINKITSQSTVLEKGQTVKKIDGLVVMATAIGLLGLLVGYLGAQSEESIQRGIGALLAISGIFVVTTLLFRLMSRMNTSGLSDMKNIMKFLAPTLIAIGSFVGMIWLLKGIEAEKITAISAGFAAFTVMIAGLSAVIAGLGMLPLPALVQGFVAFTVLLAGLMTIIAVIGKWNWLKNSLATGMEALGEIFGSFRAGFLKSLATGYSSLKNVEPVDQDKFDVMLTNAGAIQTFVESLPETSMWDGIKDLFGNSSIDQFARDTEGFINSMVSFYTKINGADSMDLDEAGLEDVKTKTQNAADIAAILNGFFTTLPSISIGKGIQSKLHLSEVDAFSGDIIKFVDAMIRFAEKMQTDIVQSSAVFATDPKSSEYTEMKNRLNNAITIANILSGFLNDLPEVDDGQYIIEQAEAFGQVNYTSINMKTFAGDIMYFIQAMADFDTELNKPANKTKLGDFAPDTDTYTRLQNALAVASQMSALFKDLPDADENTYIYNTVTGWEFGGEVYETLDMAAFGGNLLAFVLTMNNFAEYMNGQEDHISSVYMNRDVITATKNAVETAKTIFPLIQTVEEGMQGEVFSSTRKYDTAFEGVTTASWEGFLGDIAVFIESMGTYATVLSTAATENGPTIQSVLSNSKALKSATEGATGIATLIADFVTGSYSQYTGVNDTYAEGRMSAFTKTTQGFLEGFLTMINGYSDTTVSTTGVAAVNAIGLAAGDIISVYERMATMVSDLQLVNGDNLFDNLKLTDLMADIETFGASVNTFNWDYDITQLTTFVTGVNSIIENMQKYDGMANGFSSINLQLGITLDSPEETALEWLSIITDTIDTGLEEYHPTITAVVDYGSSPDSGSGSASGGTSTPVRSSSLANDVNSNSSSGIGNSGTTNTYNTSNAFNIQNSVYVTGNTLDVNNDAWYSKVATKLMEYMNKQNRSLGSSLSFR